MSVMIRRALVLSCLAVAVMAPRAASAITLEEVLSLARSGVTDTVILALIDRDQTVFAIQADQIVKLQRDGLSEKVILAMLRSGRAEGEQAARADSAYNSAWIASTLSTEPQSISVGHGPDRPNTPHIDGFYSGPPAAGGLFYAAVPWGGRSSRGHADRRRAQMPIAAQTPVVAPPLIGAPPVDLVSSPTLCLAQVKGLQSSAALSYVTACPAAMQTRRR
jgi:hypothetical protein